MRGYVGLFVRIRAVLHIFFSDCEPILCSAYSPRFAEGTVSGVSAAMQHEVFLLEEEEAPVARHLDSGATVLMQAHLSFLIRPQNAQAATVARDVEMCGLRLSMQGGSEQRSPSELAAALAARGHTVTVRRSPGGGHGTAAFRKLRHTFVTVAAAPGSGGEDLVVDPHFRCQFVLASPSPRYAALQALLPQCFVGTAEQLEHVVEWVSREVQWSFKEVGQALPPWREHRAVLSKWRDAVPARAPDASPDTCDSPSSPLTPRAGHCPCCHRPAATAAYAAAELAAGGGGCLAWQYRPSSRLSPSSVCPPDQGAERQASAALTESSPATPTHVRRHNSSGMAAQACRVSLLSRSLEAARLPLRIQQHLAGECTGAAAGAGVAAAPAPANWWEPRTIRVVPVRRSA